MKRCPVCQQFFDQEDRRRIGRMFGDSRLDAAIEKLFTERKYTSDMKMIAELSVFLLAAPEVMGAHLAPGCCLNGTRVAMNLFKNLGAKPLFVKAVAMNRIWMELMEAKGSPPDDAEEEGLWAEAGAWVVEIDLNPETAKGFPGHVVTVFPDGWLLDTASGQFRRPKKSLDVPDMLATKVPKHFSETFEGASIRLSDGGVIAYYPFPKNKTYLGAPGFEQSKNNVKLTSEVASRMEQVAQHVKKGAVTDAMRLLFCGEEEESEA